MNNNAFNSCNMSVNGTSSSSELASQIGALSRHFQQTAEKLGKVQNIMGGSSSSTLPNDNSGLVNALLSNMIQQDINQRTANNVANYSNAQAQLLMLPLYLQQLNGVIPSINQNFGQSQNTNQLNAILNAIAQGTQTPGQPNVSQMNTSVLAASQKNPQHSEVTPQSEAGIPSYFVGADGCPEFFPLKLYRLVSEAETEGYSHIVSFLPHGHSFTIHKPDEFMSEIMPRFFRQSKLTSFQRQLNHYGFKRNTGGPESGAYFHSKFCRGRPDLCAHIKRSKTKSSSRPQQHTHPDETKLPLSSMEKHVEKKAINSHADKYGPTTASTAITSIKGGANFQTQESLLSAATTPILEGANLQTSESLPTTLSSLVTGGCSNVDPLLNALSRSKTESNVLSMLFAQEQQNILQQQSSLQQQQAAAFIGNNSIGNVNNNNPLLNVILQSQNSTGGNLFPAAISTKTNQQPSLALGGNNNSNNFPYSLQGNQQQENSAAAISMLLSKLGGKDLIPKKESTTQSPVEQSTVDLGITPLLKSFNHEQQQQAKSVLNTFTNTPLKNTHEDGSIQSAKAPEVILSKANLGQ
mmetsp:Transcript_33287/g.76823  ORF Transcript_33287/g.76823 Transcript_33287/m.76823 type:complete len:580 (-) Transcript_33287:187-1926(-)